MKPVGPPSRWRGLAEPAAVLLLVLGFVLGSRGGWGQESGRGEIDIELPERVEREEPPPESTRGEEPIEDELPEPPGEEAETYLDDELGEGEDTPEDEDGWFDQLLSQLEEDPTLGGRLHLTYRATYTGRFYDFGPFEFPVNDPAAIGPDDLAHAAQLAARHRNDDDHDLDQYLSLRWDGLYREEEGALLQSVDLGLSLRYFRDLDGSPAGEASLDTFDTFSDNSRFQLLTLHTTLEAFQRHLLFTLGRQYAHEAEWIHFDGGQARFRGVTLLGRPVELGAFGGQRVKLYRRTSSSRDGIWGGYVKYWPLKNTSIKLSDVFYADNSFEVELRHTFPGVARVSVGYRQIDEHPAFVRLEASAEWASQQLTALLRTVHKVGKGADDFDFDYTRSRRREGDNPLFFNLGELAPYDEVSLELRKGFLEHYGASAGGTLHVLRDRDLRDEYNTDWQEVWAGLDVLHAPWEGLTGRLTFRYLHTDLRRRLLRLDPNFVLTNNVPDFLPEDITGDGEPDFLGVDLLLEQDLGRTVAGGATLDFRSYDTRTNFVVLENLTVSNVSAYLRWRPTRHTQWTLRYSYTRDFEFLYPDLDALHTVQVQFTYRL